MFDPAESQAIALSIRVALASVAGSLPVALGLAYLLARRQFPLKWLLGSVIFLPLVLPPVVTGYVLLVLFGKQGVLGIWLQDWLGVSIAFRWTGAAVAAAVMGLPLMVRAMRLSFEAVDPRLEQAARSLGAGPAWTFFTITLPLSLPGIIAGAVMGFAKAFGEFGATITFVSNIPGETQTLPLAIYSALQSADGDQMAMRLAMVSVVVSLGAIIAAEWVAERLRSRR